ncbi:HTH-type transcriptional regulator frlR [Chlamydia trachomatis]|nr:HTH-type transcriptional regulator frlR [Chlamydia trachomatis]
MKREELFILRDIDSFEPATAQMRKKGYTFSNRVLEVKRVPSNHYLSQELNIPLNTELFLLSRLRIVEGYPVSIEKTWIQYEKVKGLEKVDFTDISFYALLKEKFGIQIIETKEELLIVNAKQSEKEHLNTKQILFEKGTSYMEGESVPFEYFEMSSIPSFYRFRSVSVNG